MTNALERFNKMLSSSSSSGSHLFNHTTCFHFVKTSSNLLVRLLSAWIVCAFLLLPPVYGQYRVTPHNTIGVEGQSAVIQCAITNGVGLVIWNHLVSGKPTIQLSVGGNIDLTVGMDQKQRIKVVGNRGRGEYHLRIRNVKMSDAGRYECMALVGLTRIVKRSAALRVVRPPDPGYPICRMEPAFGLRPGSEVVLSCETMGGLPVAMVRWTDGTKAVTPNTEGFVDYKKTLTAADYGMKYVCQEITPAYKPLRTCEVIPLEVDIKVDLQPSVRVEVRPGQSLAFSCYGQSIKAFTYAWELNDQPLPFLRNLIVYGSNGDKLRFDRLSAANDNAKVTCVLTNAHGFKVRTSTIISVMSPRVQPPPKPAAPTNPSVVYPQPPDPPAAPTNPSVVYPQPPDPKPTWQPPDPKPTWRTGDYEVQYDSDASMNDWGMGLDPPYGGGTDAMSSPAMTAVAALLIGIFMGVIVAVSIIIARKYMKSRADGSSLRLTDRTQSTSIPYTVSVSDQGSGGSVLTDGPIFGSRGYDLPPRDYPSSGRRNTLSYLGLRPESMQSVRTEYQGLNSEQVRLSTYDPSLYSGPYEGYNTDGTHNQEYYEDVIGDEQRESAYHYQFSPPVDPSEIRARCMSADRSTRHFFPH